VTEFLKNRAPLDAQILERELRLRQCLWQNAILKDEVTSTNDVAKELTKSETFEGTFVVANFQTKGRGRQDRSWEAPKNSSIFMSIILKPNNQKEIGWIPLLVGLSLFKSLESETRKIVKIKWPNDLVIVEAEEVFKFAGILIEKHNDYIIVGVGINFDQQQNELPIKNATSLKSFLQNDLSKESIIAQFISELGARWVEENNAQSSPTPSLVREYKTNCLTIGSQIIAQLPGGENIKAKAVDISQTGELIIETTDGLRNLSSADIHLIS
jgi:BirA family biotin operon repressor/biotin-[acetyl-CoA-carboxylase] ligase